MGSWWHPALFVGVLALESACNPAVFQCSQSADCGGGSGAVCEANGYCSFPDGTCPSGRRYGELAPAAVAGACVVPDAGGSTTAGDTTSTTGTSSTAGSTSLTTTSSSSSDSTLSSSTTNVDPGSTSAASNGTAATSTSAGLVRQTVSISATVAACTDATSNDPAACQLATMTDGFSVDQMNSDLMGLESRGFVAFELDRVPVGAQIVGATLQLTTTDVMGSDSTDSGEVWKTEPFTLASLSMGQPALEGNAAISPDQGAVGMSALVEWPLPPGELEPTGELFLAIVPISPSGVDYWDLDGTAPPALVLELLVPSG